jgi:deoxyribonuclease (pyrimidine dimer)
MVRINLINPKKLSDQHLIAEYNEMLMLIEYIRRNPSLEKIPKNYCLGKGHMKFFKDKVLYLKKRHKILKNEMIKRNFHPTKTLQINQIPKNNKNDWHPVQKDKEIIKKRIKQKIKQKPIFYRYYSKIKPPKFFLELLR